MVGQSTSLFLPFPGAGLTKHTLSLFSSAFCTGRAHRRPIWKFAQVTFSLSLPAGDTGLVGALICPLRRVPGPRIPPGFHIQALESANGLIEWDNMYHKTLASLQTGCS